MPDQAGLILGQIPYFKEQKLQLNALVCPGGMGGGGCLAYLRIMLCIIPRHWAHLTWSLNNTSFGRFFFFMQIAKNLILFVNNKLKIDMLSTQQQIARLPISFHGM